MGVDRYMIDHRETEDRQIGRHNTSKQSYPSLQTTYVPCSLPGDSLEIQGHRHTTGRRGGDRYPTQVKVKSRRKQTKKKGFLFESPEAVSRKQPYPSHREFFPFGISSALP